jgi:RimJ/RimL family protein N-acetyltransferase
MSAMTPATQLRDAAQFHPARAVELHALADGKPLLVRPLAARDTGLLQDFVRGLSVTSRYQRFQGAMQELAPDLLARLLAFDHRRSVGFAAIVFEHGSRRMIGEARYAPALDDAGTVDFALAVSDAWQRQGVGRLLFGRLLQHAERSGIERIQGDVLHGNAAMLALARQAGFAACAHPDGAWLARVERRLGTLALAA